MFVLSEDDRLIPWYLDLEFIRGYPCFARNRFARSLKYARSPPPEGARLDKAMWIGACPKAVEREAKVKEPAVNIQSERSKERVENTETRSIRTRKNENEKRTEDVGEDVGGMVQLNTYEHKSGDAESPFHWTEIT